MNRRVIRGRAAVRNAAHEMLDLMETLSKDIAPRTPERADRINKTLEEMESLCFRMIGTTPDDAKVSHSKPDAQSWPSPGAGRAAPQCFE